MLVKKPELLDNTLLQVNIPVRELVIREYINEKDLQRLSFSEDLLNNVKVLSYDLQSMHSVEFDQVLQFPFTAFLQLDVVRFYGVPRDMLGHRLWDYVTGNEDMVEVNRVSTERWGIQNRNLHKNFMVMYYFEDGRSRFLRIDKAYIDFSSS